MITRIVRQVWNLTQIYREPYRTLWALGRLKQYSDKFHPLNANIGRWNVTYIDGHALRSMWTLQFLRRYNDFYSPNDSPRILDCGSNIGVSVIRYKELYPLSRITAFEPDPDICKVLRMNIARNNLSDVEVVEAAVWTANGTLPFTRLPQDDTQAGHLGLSEFSKETITVPTVWLGDYIQTPIDFVKLDIEGAELDVLMSCRHLLTNIRQMIIEVHYYVNKPDVLIEILNLLKSSGFKIALYQYFGPPTYLPFVTNPHSSGDQFPLLWAWQE